jgi:hypothetical protein
MAWAIAGAMLAGSGAGQSTQTAATPGVPMVRFSISGPGAQGFGFELREDGSGNYRAADDGGGAAQGEAAKLSVSAKTAGRIFEEARAVAHGGFVCASKAKGIANTGAKTLAYQGADESGSCTYNYTENKNVHALADTFRAMAMTLDEGRKLAFKHRYDPLGLDAEMTVLTEMAKAGQAVELRSIAPVLESLANDTTVMERVRVRAAELLKMAEGS